MGLAIVASGGWLLLSQAVDHGSAVGAAWRGGLVAAAATALGTLPVLLSHRISQRTSDAMLGFGAGVMLAATVFSLLLPALAAAGAARGGDAWGAGAVVASALVLGALALLSAGHWWPGREAAPRDAALDARRGAWLFIAAITLHNLPEGLAIGVAYGGTSAAHAAALATGIAIQDVPEGLVVALALRSVGHGRIAAAALGAASGFIEPLAAVAGAALISITTGLLPWGLGFAAGAMLYAICHEAIPRSHRQGHATLASAGVIVGFVLMMLLDTALAPPAPAGG